jgi:hypothetical protein
MAYPQAFHTSCRKGLSAHAGFQYNAASDGLDQEQLARLAAAHAGYQTPPDSPAEPSEGEIAGLPVALRYRPVEGVGPAVSQTTYVGREFRGRDGEPDSGRFGNYFSHILVGEDGGDGEGGFGGLLPIELWSAPHWTSVEVDETRLEPLAELAPGPLDLDRVLGDLPAEPEFLAAVAEASLRAVLGGPRLVLVEADLTRAAAWVAWASYSLPPDRGRELTFSTFAGRPRLTEGLHLCVTTPSCDVDFAPHELGSSVVVIDTAAGIAPAEPSLYGRVLASLAAGAEAIAAAVRELPPGLELAAAGAELAVAARRTGLAGPDDAAAVLGALERRIDRVPAALLAELAAELPRDDVAFEQWARLYAAARMSSDPEATALVDAALDRVLDSLPDADRLPRVDPGSNAVPSAAVLVKWLGLVNEAAGGKRFAPLLTAGVRLGLVGCNTALDKELAMPIAAGFADPGTQLAYEELGRAGNALVVEAVALELAATAASGGGIEALRKAAADPVARAAVRREAAEGDDFEAVAAWQLLRVDNDPGCRAEAAALLAGLAREATHEQIVRGLYGELGPDDPGEHLELLAAWQGSGQDAPIRDYEVALQCLAAIPLREMRRGRALYEGLRAAPAARGDLDLAAWDLVVERPPGRRDLVTWTKALLALHAAGSGLPRSRREELALLAAHIAASCLDQPDCEPALALLLSEMDDEWPLQLGDALARSLEKTVNPQRRIAEAFETWGRPRHWSKVLLGTALPRATLDRPPKELEAVGEILPEAIGPSWDEWLEEHPPRRAVSRAVRGVFRRGGER